MYPPSLPFSSNWSGYSRPHSSLQVFASKDSGQSPLADIPVLPGYLPRLAEDTRIVKTEAVGTGDSSGRVMV